MSRYEYEGTVFLDVQAKENHDHCLDYEDPFSVKDLEVAEIVKKSAMVYNANKVQSFDTEHRNKPIKELDHPCRALKILCFAIFRKNLEELDQVNGG